MRAETTADDIDRLARRGVVGAVLPSAAVPARPWWQDDSPAVPPLERDARECRAIGGALDAKPTDPVLSGTALLTRDGIESVASRLGVARCAEQLIGEHTAVLHVHKNELRRWAGGGIRERGFRSAWLDAVEGMEGRAGLLSRKLARARRTALN